MTATGQKRRRGFLGMETSDRLELTATVVMAMAATLTAWSAFQSSKWSGVQALEFSRASAARIESTRADARANQQRAVDVLIFTSWLDAIADEETQGEIPAVAEHGYVPRPDTLSAFYYERMREEFRPALVAWLRTEPLRNPESPPTPFAMDEYRLESSVLAQALIGEAEAHGEAAGEANLNSDSYVLSTVGFALVIFFAGISSKLASRRNRSLAIGLAIAIFAVGFLAVVRLPRVPFF